MLSMKNAVSSAVDVMQAMGSSICHLLSKVRLVAEYYMCFCFTHLYLA